MNDGGGVTDRVAFAMSTATGTTMLPTAAEVAAILQMNGNCNDASGR